MPSFAPIVADIAPGPTIVTTIGLVVGAILLVLALLMFVAYRFLNRQAASARSEFLTGRSKLEAEFFRAAAMSGKPRGLRWTGCEWTPGVEFARDRATGQITALVGVTIQFEAIPGSDMEGVAAVGNLRNASAVFFHDRGAWRTIGKAVFNLNPDEVLAHFAGQYERLPAQVVE